MKDWTEIKESAFISYKRLPPYKYALAEDALFDTGCCPEQAIYGDLCTLHADGWLEIKAGYPWDGPTMAPDCKDMMRASIVHDSLYRLRQEGHPVPKDWKKRADSVFNRLCREDGGSGWKRFFARNGIKHFGKADPKELNRYREIKVAP